MIFQGQEFLEDGWFDDTKPLDWSRLQKNPGIFALYKELFNLRRNAMAQPRDSWGSLSTCTTSARRAGLSPTIALAKVRHRRAWS